MGIRAKIYTRNTLRRYTLDTHFRYTVYLSEWDRSEAEAKTPRAGQIRSRNTYSGTDHECIFGWVVMELEDLGPPTFAETVVRYRGQLLELKTSNYASITTRLASTTSAARRTSWVARSKNPYYAKFLPPGEKKQRVLPGSMSATAEGAASKLAWYVATQQELRAVVPLTQPRKSAEVRCSHALRLISCVCLMHTHTLMSQEVHLM